MCFIYGSSYRDVSLMSESNSQKPKAAALSNAPADVNKRTVRLRFPGRAQLSINMFHHFFIASNNESKPNSTNIGLLKTA